MRSRYPSKCPKEDKPLSLALSLPPFPFFAAYRETGQGKIYAFDSRVRNPEAQRIRDVKQIGGEREREGFEEGNREKAHLPVSPFAVLLLSAFLRVHQQPLGSSFSFRCICFGAEEMMSDLKFRRLYQVWKGNNRFFCGGRCIYGPDVVSILLSMLMIAAPIITFCYQISVKIQKYKKLHEEDGILDHQHVLGYPVLALTIFIMLADFSFLFLTSSRDPGIVPRNAQPLDSPETSEVNTPSIEWISGITPHLRLPRTKDVIVNGLVVKVKYCDTCFLYRPPRTSHCSICNNCVQKFDHHCPWIGQCIGLRNYRFFFFFISTSTFLCIYVFTLSVMNIIQERKNYHYSFTKLIVGEIISVVLIVYTFLSVWFVGGLTAFHLYLISTNQAWVLHEAIGNESHLPHMGMDVFSTSEKTDVEMGSTLVIGGNMPIPSILQNTDYSSISSEKQRIIDKQKSDAPDPLALANMQENDCQGSSKYEHSWEGQEGTSADIKYEIDGDETIIGGLAVEDAHVKST